MPHLRKLQNTMFSLSANRSTTSIVQSNSKIADLFYDAREECDDEAIKSNQIDR